VFGCTRETLDEIFYDAPERGMSFANTSPFVAQPLPLIDAQGRDVIVAIVKATFEIDAAGRAVLAELQTPVRVNDVPRDPDNPNGSVLLPSDVCVEKAGTDVVIVGDAIAPKPTTALDVAVSVCGALAPLRVHGPRVFVNATFGVGIGPAAPFERLPIAYEYAYGGTSEDFSVVELRNPAGVGVAKRAADLVDKRAPQIEHPDRPHKSRSDAHAPMGFGAIMSHWSPRREYAGTFDETWQKTRMPLPPKDYDRRFGNVAHPSLQFAEHLRAGDAVGVVGMSPAPLSLALPPLPVVLRARFDESGRVEVRPPIDTVVIFPEKRRLELIARGAFPMGRNKDILREVVVDADG
jgi:hypothetical protein